ncbi:SsgA family sporulation/cell division regulator [Streptomyces sp. NRRL F-5135]|uniref:SsgA family sporulation/cell division regulator n=1 Tax=Streptomyces sp. NRRL F-5135 TaxID=1463858 RepID=UPI0007C5742A|nr:SsgA family sporulation/cell division regulator [Streptomyces sp. NRRL F-5135]
MSPTVEQPAKARLITDAPWPRTVSVLLRYDGEDPLALRIVFPPEVSRDQGEVVWSFARDLLEAGLRLPSGDGDVEVWPCGRAQTVVEFHSPDGVAVVQFDSAPLRRFLRSCSATAPAKVETKAGARTRARAAEVSGSGLDTHADVGTDEAATPKAGHSTRAAASGVG